MAVRRVDPDEASELLEQGWSYLDVRSVSEYSDGHAPGAYNIPLLDFAPGQGLTPNTNFLGEVLETFDLEQPLVVACKSGGRSARAAAILAESGFTNVV